MKVVHVGLDLVPSSGGSVVSIRDFSKVTESSIISFTQPTKLKRECSAIHGTIHIETSAGFFGRTFSWAPHVNRRFAMECISGADVIVCHVLLRYHVHWVRAMAKKYKIPYLIIPHGCLDPYVFSYRSLVKKVWFYLFGNPFLKSASGVIFATKRERLKASRYYSGQNCHVIHWPVSALDVDRRALAKAAICSKHGIGLKDKIIIFLGRLHPTKRPLETIAAFAQAQISGTHLVIIGPEETLSRQQCLDLIVKLGVENVHLVGPIYGEDKNDYLLASDAYISLSLKENFGYTAAEALSAGLPLILSPGNDLADDLAALDCGWMLPDDMTETAASAINEFASLPMNQLQTMGQRGRCWALENLCFEKFAERVQSVLRKILE